MRSYDLDNEETSNVNSATLCCLIQYRLHMYDAAYISTLASWSGACMPIRYSRHLMHGLCVLQMAKSYDTPTLAMFSFTPDKHVQAQLDICLEADILEGATVSIYVDMKFTW